MSQPVKVSDALLLDARLAGAAVERSIAGQIEFWAKLGRALEPLLQGDKVLALCRAGDAKSLSACLRTVNSATGHQRVVEHLKKLPFPHYEPLPGAHGFLVRIEADGKRVAGRFIDRKFRPGKPTVKAKHKPLRTTSLA